MDQNEQTEQKIIIRVCKTCNHVKNIDMFPTNSNKKYATHLHRCKECHKMLRCEQNKKYYANKKTRASKHNTPDVVCVAGA